MSEPSDAVAIRATSNREVDSSEIEVALAALGRDDLARLMVVARFRARALGRFRRGKDHDDLLNEAVLRTLSGQRAWNPAVDLVRHLSEAMRSIVWEWRTRSQRGDGAESPEAWSLDPRGEGAGPLARVADGEANAERASLAAEELRELEKRFSEDPEILALLAAWAEGHKGPEIQAAQGWSEKQYRAAVRRLRRGALALSGD